jgi:hypothetical protein
MCLVLAPEYNMPETARPIPVLVQPVARSAPYRRAVCNVALEFFLADIQRSQLFVRR